MPCLAVAAEPATELPASVIQSTSDADSYTRTETSTASKGSTQIRDEAQTVNTVAAQTLDDYQVKDLNDAMRFVSGVTQTNTLGGTKDALIKRGFGSNDDNSILRDGIRSAIGRNLGATTDHVEVLKGPASLMYGALEPGGLINVISKQPQFSRSTTLTGSGFSEGGGSFGIDTTGPLGDTGLAYRLIAERSHEDYWRNYGVDEHTLIAPSIAWVGERASFSLAYTYNDYSSPFDRGTVFVNGRPADISYRDRLDERWAKTVGISESTTAKFEYQLNDAWRSRLTYGWTEDRYSLAIAQPNALTGNNLRRIANGGHYDYESRYTALDLMGDQQLFGQRHEITVGVDNESLDKYRGKTYRNANTAAGNLNIQNPVYGNLAEPATISSTQSNAENNLVTTSVYFKDNWHLNDRWILVLGGRQEHWDQYSDQGLGSSYAPGADSNGDKFIPFGGIVYQPTETVALYANYSRSFVPNDADDAGNSFKPTEGRSYEVGIKYTPVQALNVNLAVYDIVKKNLVNSVLQSNGDSLDEAVGKARSRGVELDITGELSENWSMIGTYAYNRTEVLKNEESPEQEGNRLPNAPMHTASLYLTHHLALPAETGKWHVGAGARYVGERPGDDANSFWMDSYTVADAFVRWDLPTHDYKTSLQLNIDNLFNKEYYPSTTGSSALQVEEGALRTARVTASVTF
ncbi:TonB-dependent siderophore receptor [Pseudomonas sp. KFB-139]|uniref:TonB-dependent siderophore receptor n=1 Tax=Pseudomonas serbiensis TaxID=3064350 RepID=A0ABT9CI98_9PSED|nr:TonB-dependent siderophore receptor [Pseudomonas sp. KFB-138]MDO7925194.1 TonB-dependent siderophore receptor [Pseudomonas sp. KFB-138]